MINNKAYETYREQVNKVPTLQDLRQHARVGAVCRCGNCFCCAAETANARFHDLADEIDRNLGVFERISDEAGDKLIKIMDSASYLCLQIIAERNVKFAAGLARNRIRKIEQAAAAKGISVAVYLDRGGK